MKVRKVWQPECETAGHVTSAMGKPRDTMVVLSSHSPARSVTGTCHGMVPPTLKVLGGYKQQTLLVGAGETGGFKQQDQNSRTLWVN